MTNLEARHADGRWFGFLQQHGYVPKVLRTHGMMVSERVQVYVYMCTWNVMAEGQMSAEVISTVEFSYVL